MKKRNPKKNLVISWIVMGIGALLAVAGAVTAQGYRLNLWLLIGLLVIVSGIVCHFVTVWCRDCG